MTLFLEKKYQTFLLSPQADGAVLNAFAALWAKKMDWFEAPNVRRGGWSGVGKATITGVNGEVLPVFIKKQQNHGRRTLLHPFKGEPTFRREFANLRFLADHQFLAPEVVLYAESAVEGQMAAVLMTRALDSQPLDDYLKSSSATRALTIKIAQEMRRFHDLGMVHRALYPKHIFIKTDGDLQVAVIDLEKARHVHWRWYATFFDLAALHRHTKYVRRTLRLRFFLSYMQQETLGFWSKILLRMLLQRSRR